MERISSSHTLEAKFQQQKSSFNYVKINSPVGPLTLIASPHALVALQWGENKHEIFKAKQNKNHPILKESAEQLARYFSGKLKSFNIPLAPIGTKFQLKAWNILRGIPYGKYISYGEQARRLGNPNASRAVGSANGKNPIAIIVPCHRVIGANGTLTGFGGGLGIKRQLLELEGISIKLE